MERNKKTLSDLSARELRNAILDRRAAIRYHRDQRGDDRCWLDDSVVWAALADTPSEPTSLPDYPTMMRHCRAFFENRSVAEKDPTPADALLTPEDWDRDLKRKTKTDCVTELLKILNAIRVHRDIRGRTRNADDDRALYRVLPEKLPADFRLPSEEAFLGDADPCAGCPSFWKSHQSCPVREHDLHQWGPCE